MGMNNLLRDIEIFKGEFDKDKDGANERAEKFFKTHPNEFSYFDFKSGNLYMTNEGYSVVKKCVLGNDDGD